MPSKRIDKPCMFCGKPAGLEEKVSPYKGVVSVLVRCTYCGIDFVASFQQKIWNRIQKVQKE